MPTEIRMYNCAFGDCFRITKSDAPDGPRKVLFVDFGIHKRCSKEPENWKDQRYQAIVDDILDDYRAPHGNVDFLLTHYHYDHYSGLDYLPDNWKFNNVYIPDVWDDEIDIRVVELLLLRDVYTKATLDTNRSLISFLIKICHATGRIYFVQRGRPIQERDDYIALAPSVNLINEEANRVWGNIPIGNDEKFSLDIESIAQDLRDIVREMRNAGNEEARQQYIPKLGEIEQRLQALIQPENDEGSVQRNLSSFANRINIIFHNRIPCNRNILFTGDADGDDEGSTKHGKKEWQLIEQNTDHEVPLHERYHVIKIPHHGTRPHYHDFTAKSTNETIYLIPNGKIKQWSIDARYAVNANKCGCSVYCSSNGACAATNIHGCTCSNGHIVPENPNPYQDI